MGKYKDPEKHLQYMRNYYAKNKEKIREYQRNYTNKHSKENRERAKQWRINNREKYNANTAKSAHKMILKIRNEIHNLLGSKCIRCGFSDIRALQIDHVKGYGREERKNFSNYYVYLRYILNEIKSGSKDYQLLCANCNTIKKVENRECPISKFS